MTIKELREILDKIEATGGETVYVYYPKNRTYLNIREVYFDRWDGSITIKTEN